MKGNNDKSASTFSIPDIHFIMVYDNGKLRIVELDDYGIDEKEIIMSIYEQEIEKYGEHNVRMCRVVSAKVKKTIEFIE